MAPVKQITIGGFRGILARLSLQFLRGKRPRSMTIYGRNGTGKSSITDAWEWFHTERVAHLAREGAGATSFPHRKAKAGETFVEVEFDDEELGTVRLDFDHSRVTMPVAKGAIGKFRKLAPHPCHIRFEDLTRFVYLTKTEKYDALAQLMGFTAQVEFQKALRRALRQLSEESETHRENVNRLQSEMASLLGIDPVDEPSVVSALNVIAERHGIEAVDSVEKLGLSIQSLTQLVEDDPRSQELADLSTLRNALDKVRVPAGLEGKLKSYVDSAEALSLQEKAALDLLLIGLYEQGEHVLRAREKAGEEITLCPLCGRPYEGDLVEHISSELIGLRDLKRSRDDIDGRRKQILQELRPLTGLAAALRRDCEGHESLLEEWGVDTLLSEVDEIQRASQSLASALSTPPEKLQAKTIQSIREASQDLKGAATSARTRNADLLSQVTDRATVLKEDTSRTQLVADQNKAASALELWKRLASARKQSSRLEEIHRRFARIVEDYVQCSIQNVQKRFEVISSDVQTYFEILEQDSEALGRPELKLLQEQDRAVVLQVEFHGEPIYPAYRYLSESQLNSFGLVVFLASAKYFNPDFRFLILDDVINSFDAYKRPQVIRLLKQEFSDHQVLLLTHDLVWCDRLYEECPDWVKQRFVRLEPGLGPIVREGVAPLAVIESLLDEDEPVRAGRNMGPFLERQFQELCEAFEVMVKYNQRNEYTLDPLLDRCRVRVREKLGTSHALCQAIEGLQSEAGFRNLCAHAKNPDIMITSNEMRAVVACWKVIESLVRCGKGGCCGFLRYDGKSGFVCECGSTHLTKI